MTTDTEQTIEQQRHAYIESLGLDYSARFVPFSQSRHKDAPQPDINWVLTLTRGRQSMLVEYSQGIGHLPGYKHLWGKQTLDVRREQQLRVEYGTEQGKTFCGLSSRGAPIGIKPLPAPPIQDVLWCLVLDSDVLNYATFEEWAVDFGYGPDSRKGEAVYRECIAQALQFRALIGDAAIETLRELFQDY